MAADLATAATDPAQANPATYSVVKTFDTIGGKYGVAFENVPAQMRSLAWVNNQLQERGLARASILDIGSGTGTPAASTFAQAGHDVLGVDISSRMVEVARELVPLAHFEVADVRIWEPSTSQGQYDAVTVFFSLIAGVTQAEIREFFRRAFSWLRPGGVFVFGTVPVEGESVHIKWMGLDVVVSGLSDQDCFQSIEGAGFEIVKVDKETFTPNGVLAGICKEEDIWEEPHMFVWARKPI